jgi:hypothetical protein
VAKCVEKHDKRSRRGWRGITDVISTRVLVASTHQADLVTAWNVVREAFGEHDVPSTLLGVTVLGYGDQLVEIEAVAAGRPLERRPLAGHLVNPVSMSQSTGPLCQRALGWRWRGS